MNQDQNVDVEHVREKLAEVQAITGNARNQAQIDFWQARLDFLLQTDGRSRR